MGGVRVTVVVRWVPGLAVQCGTRVARPAREEGGLGPRAVTASRLGR